MSTSSGDEYTFVDCNKSSPTNTAGESGSCSSGSGGHKPRWMGNNSSSQQQQDPLDSPHQTDSPSATSSDSPASSVMSPHTPLFSPGGSSSGGPVSPEAGSSELTEPLVQAGWTKCFSQRENRSYYFNRLSRQSTWDYPQSSLLLSLSSSDSNRSPPGGRGGGMLGKRSSSDASSTSSTNPVPYKKFIPSSDWDLSVASNVKMCERVPSHVLPPLPQMELARWEELLKFRSLAAELFNTKDGCQLATDALNRWIMERKLKGTGTGVDGNSRGEGSGTDPLFRSNFNPADTSPTLERDILNSVPIKNQKVVNIQDARRFAAKYAEAAKRMAVTNLDMSSEERKQIKWHCEAMFDFLRNPPANAAFEEYLERLVNGARKRVTTGVTRLEGTAADMANSLTDRHRDMLVEAGIDLTDDPLPAPRADKMVTCYSIQLRFATPRLDIPPVKMEQSRHGWVALDFKGKSMRINATHFYKLEQLYRYNTFDDRKFELFLSRVWTLLKRYDCLYGPGVGEGLNLQRSLPVSVFNCLKTEFGATFEAFASPLNCYFRQYCSIFADTDGFFGSRGNFMDFYPNEGSFVVHPPFVEEVMEKTAEKVMECLRNASSFRPLAFMLFLPEWQDPPLAAEAILEQEPKFLQKKLVIPAYEHFHRHGAQQNILSFESFVPL